MPRQQLLLRRFLYLLSSSCTPFAARLITAAVITSLCNVQLFAQSAADAFAKATESHKYLAGYNRGGVNLRKKLALSPDKIVKTYHYAPAEGRLDSRPGPTPKDLFLDHICKADAIVLGSVDSIRSLLSADESQVFTDYTFTPITIIKGRDMTPGAPLYITQPGGTVHIDGGEIVDIGSEYPSPLLPKKTYLLFLTSVVDLPNSFRPIDNLSTYLLDGSHIRTVTESPEREPVNAFLWSWSSGSLSTVLQQHSLTCVTHAQ